MRKLIILGLMFCGVLNAQVNQFDNDTVRNSKAIEILISNDGVLVDSTAAHRTDIDLNLSKIDSSKLVFNYEDSTAFVSTLDVDSITTGALHYDDTYFDDLKAPFSTTKRGSNSLPHFDYDNIGLLFPSGDTTEIVYAIMQFAHKRKNGTDIEPHIHWLQQNSNDVVWVLQYKWFDNGDPVPATWTQIAEDHDVFTYSTGTLLQITDFPAIDGSGIVGVSSIFLVKVWRDDSVDGGAGSNDVLSFEFDLHYQSDSPGSGWEYYK